MKRIYSFLVALFALTAMPLGAFAQGWPANYGGVMLQGFSWDSYVDTQWSNLESQAQDFKGYFDLIWVPNSGNCNNSSNNMGYMPYYYFNQNSSFGTEAQLRSMIKTFKANGIGTIADVVVNHHNTSGWFSFPAETYNGVTYQLQSTDITANDDNGATATEAKKEGVSLSSNNDEGEDWSGCRDLDHKSTNVQTIIKAYTKYLVDDLGYTGFRYDMVKGFSGSHVGDYNDNAGVKYSVGEYWDSNSSIENWINATGKRSAAFDFQFRYNVRDAINNSNWTKLNSDNNLIHDANYRQYAVTFVENHDMQDRGTTSGYTPDPILRDTLAANAYLLAMPGTPCVFLTHWKAYEKEIKSMILARKLAGITNTSTYENKLRSSKYYSNLVTGTDGKQLAVVLGTGYNDRLIDATFPGFIKVLSGYHYAYYLNPACETAWADKASGEYSDAFKVTLTAVSATSDAQLVYTLDGTTPTASSSKVASGSTIDITSDCTLTVGLLKKGKVDGIQTYNYTIKKFVAHKATVYFKDPQWTTSVYFYAWANDGKSTTLNGSWPGKVITATKEINGEKWYYQSFDINTADYSFNIIFNQGNGKLQTVDIGPISEDKYYELGDLSNGKYTYKDVTSTITTGIRTINASTTSSNPSWYTLSGVRLSKEPMQSGVYIHEGKKVVK